MVKKKFSKKTIALAVVAAVLGACSVLYPEYLDTATGLLTSVVNSGLFSE
jgi:ABC-type glycerol-3-phosphate transport system substrate-binding protein